MITVSWRLQKRPVTVQWRGPDRDVILEAAEDGPPTLAAVIAVRDAPENDPGDFTLIFDNRLV